MLYMFFFRLGHKYKITQRPVEQKQNKLPVKLIKNITICWNKNNWQRRRSNNSHISVENRQDQVERVTLSRSNETGVSMRGASEG